MTSELSFKELVAAAIERGRNYDEWRRKAGYAPAAAPDASAPQAGAASGIAPSTEDAPGQYIPPAPSAADPHHNPVLIAEAWELLRYYLTEIQRVFWPPSVLAEQKTLRACDRKELLHWLRPLEHLARRLLLIGAARIARADLGLRAKADKQKAPCAERSEKGAKQADTTAVSGPSARARPPREDFTNPDSTQWRVSFRIFPAQKTKKRRRRRSYRPYSDKIAREPRNAGMAFAARMEALMRVVCDAGSYIRRAAVRIYRAGVKFAQRLFTEYTSVDPRCYPGRGEIGGLYMEALLAVEHFHRA